MQTQPEQSKLQKDVTTSDWRRVVLFIAGMILAVAGFSQYVADISAMLS